MYPYSVESKNFHVGLFQLSDGRFQMIKQGNLSNFMSGADYLLIENKLANFLSNLDIPLIDFRDAIVWNRKLDKEYKNFKQLIVKKYATEESFEHWDLSGLQMYLYGRNHLFVSPKLKEKLERSEFEYLLFGKGFSRFVV